MKKSYFSIIISFFFETIVYIMMQLVEEWDSLEWLLLSKLNLFLPNLSLNQFTF